jgi:predicted metal-dependent peptidase
MVEFAPSSGGLALWAQHRDLADEPGAPGGASAPTVATDGRTVHYAAGFERLPLAEQTGLVAHEVLHIALRHPQRLLDLRRVLGDVDARLYNICADAIVNSAIGHLSWLALPRGAVSLERLLASALSLEAGPESALLEWDVERLYRAIDDRQPADSGGRSPSRKQQAGGAGSQSDPAGSGGTQARPKPSAASASRPDDSRTSARADGPRAASVRALGATSMPDLLPGPETEEAPEAQADQAHAWSERILRAHAGDGEFSLLRTLLRDLPRSRTPWEQLLRTQLARGLSTRPDLSWSRPSRSYIANQGRSGPNRRMPWEPGHSGTKKVPRLVLIVDVSGSIEDGLLARFGREIEAIARRLEAGVVLVIGDDRVRRVEHFAPGGLRPRAFDLGEIEFSGGGGTDFTPLLEEAGRHRPDLVVVLTDLDGPARCRPRWPVLWAVPGTHAAAVPPFGRLLVLE